MIAIKNVVLVHGSFVDGAGWESVFRLLTRRGYNVSVVQIPTTTLEADLAATKRILDQQDGDVVLVGHSYGGVVISEAGNHPKVKRLVYVTAFAPDAGESVASLIANPPPGAAAPPILPPQNGFLLLDQSKLGEQLRLAENRFRENFVVEEVQTPGPEPDQVDQKNREDNDQDQDDATQPLQDAFKHKTIALAYSEMRGSRDLDSRQFQQPGQCPNREIRARLR